MKISLVVGSYFTVKRVANASPNPAHLVVLLRDRLDKLVCRTSPAYKSGTSLAATAWRGIIRNLHYVNGRPRKLVDINNHLMKKKKFAYYDLWIPEISFHVNLAILGVLMGVWPNIFQISINTFFRSFRLISSRNTDPITFHVNFAIKVVKTGVGPISFKILKNHFFCSFWLIIYIDPITFYVNLRGTNIFKIFKISFFVQFD